MVENDGGKKQMSFYIYVLILYRIMGDSLSFLSFKILLIYSAIKKNSFESVLMRWMKLEPITQSEVSQKDKDHYNILTHIYGI